MQQPELLDRALVELLRDSISDPLHAAKHNLITSAAQNLGELMTEIAGPLQSIVPNVIVLGESSPLAAWDSLTSLLMAYPELRVIVVSEDTNWLHFFHKKDVLMTQKSDLLDLIDF